MIIILINLPKVIWEEGRVAALQHTHAEKSPLVTMACLKFAPKVPLPVNRFPNPFSSLDPSNPWFQTASGSDPPFFHNALDRPTDARTYVPTDRSTDRPHESLTTIGRCAARATRPNNISLTMHVYVDNLLCVQAKRYRLWWLIPASFRPKVMAWD